MRPAEPQSFNRYSYVENHPLTRTDPSGLSSGRPGGSLPGANGALGRVGPGRGMDPSFGKPRRPDQRTTQPSGKLSEAEAVVDLVVDQPMGAPGVGTQSQQAALSAEAATNAVRSVVLPMVNNNKQCRNFLDGMLSELDRSTRVSPIRRSFLGVFKTLSKQVGFYDGSGLFDDYGQTTLIGGNLSIGLNFSKAEPTGPFALEINAVHEVVHAAARGDLYDEFDMAQAAYDVGKRMGLVPALVPEPMKPGSEVADRYNTRLVNQIIFFACKAN